MRVYLRRDSLIELRGFQRRNRLLRNCEVVERALLAYIGVGSCINHLPFVHDGVTKSDVDYNRGLP